MNKASLLVFLLLLAFSTCLSSCGKVSNLDTYEGSGYPHSYPRQ